MQGVSSEGKGLDFSRIGDMTAADPAAGAGAGQGIGGRYPLEGRHVCPFCGTLNETMDGPCPQCTMSNTAETRKATKSRIGPWYVLQSRNPAAPGMRYETLLGFVHKGRVKARSIVRGPTTHQLWRFACQVKGLSREFGLCYSCGGSIEHEAQLCPQCNRLQDPPADPDTFLEGQGASPAAANARPAPPAASATRPIAPAETLQEIQPGPIYKELKLPPLADFPSAGDGAPRTAAAGSVDAAAIPLGAPISTVPPTAALSAQTPAPAPTSPPPFAGPRKRNANDVFLSAKDLAAAFQLEFDGKDDDASRTSRGDDFEADAPWTGAASAAAQPARSAHRRPRRKRRLGRLVLLLLVLGVGGAAAYLTLNAAARGRVFAWAEAKYMALTGADLYPDLNRSRSSAGGGEPSLGASTTGSAPGAAPSAAPFGDEAFPASSAIPSRAVDAMTERPAASAATQRAVEGPPAPNTAALSTGAGPVARSGPRPDPAVNTPRRDAGPPPATSPAAARSPTLAPPPAGRAPRVKPPAASQPAAPARKVAEAPRMTREESERKSRELYFQALDAEERGDWKKAKELYQEIMATLPRDVWYAGTETNLRVAKDALGEK